MKELDRREVALERTFAPSGESFRTERPCIAKQLDRPEILVALERAFASGGVAP